MPCIYCLTDHAGDCPRDLGIARRRCLEAAARAESEADAAGRAAELARQAATIARCTAAVSPPVEDRALAATIQIAQKATAEALTRATHADAARALATDAASKAHAAAEAAQRAIREVWGIVAVYERTHPAGIDRRDGSPDRRRGMKDDWLRWQNPDRRLGVRTRRG